MVGFGVQALYFKVWRDRLWTSGCKVQRSAVGVSALGVWGVRFGVGCLVFGVWCLVFGVWGLWFGVWGLGFRG